jgi:hypothetical protein
MLLRSFRGIGTLRSRVERAKTRPQLTQFSSR